MIKWSHYYLCDDTEPSPGWNKWLILMCPASLSASTKCHVGVMFWTVNSLIKPWSSIQTDVAGTRHFLLHSRHLADALIHCDLCALKSLSVTMFWYRFAKTKNTIHPKSSLTANIAESTQIFGWYRIIIRINTKCTNPTHFESARSLDVYEETQWLRKVYSTI